MSDPTQTGTLLRAENGDVIGYDATGLLLRLSDRVIGDIAARLQGGGAPVQSAASPAVQFGAELTEDIDAWDVQARGEWIYFQGNLRGAGGVRGYRRHIEGGTILAQSQAPLMGILAIGGARAGLASAAAAAYPYHLFAPADDIGAVGMGGDGMAQSTPQLEPLREMTHEALLAQTLLAKRAHLGAGLPLFFLRAESDLAASAADLGQGAAIDNLERALRNMVSAAGRLGVRAKLAAICLDYCIEDVTGDAAAYRDGILAVMARLTRAAVQCGLPAPVFLAGFDCGTHTITTGPALEGQWELSWNHGEGTLIFSGPSYAFAMDDTGRLTDQGRLQKAEISAEALLAQEGGARWICPTVQLAERAGSDISLTCAALEALVLDPSDPFGAGEFAGFALTGVRNGAVITAIELDPKDRKSVILRCSKRPEGEVFVTYAHGAAAGTGPYPANAGALRDAWVAEGTHGALHRWALPAKLRLTDGGQ